MNENTDEVSPACGESERRPSWPYPIFLFFYLVIFLITPTVGTNIGLILFFGLMGVCLWLSVSRKEYEGFRKNYPSLQRSEYVANMMIIPVIVPLLLFVLLVVFRNLLD